MAERWNVSRAATIAGIRREDIYKLLNTDPTFKKAFYEVKEAWLDKSEEVILEFAASGKNITANIFALKTQRPDQWGEKVDVSVKHEINALNDTQIIDQILSSRRGGG